MDSKNLLVVKSHKFIRIPWRFVDILCQLNIEVLTQDRERDHVRRYGSPGLQEGFRDHGVCS
jgi:hypothetical protein